MNLCPGVLDKGAGLGNDRAMSPVSSDLLGPHALASLDGRPLLELDADRLGSCIPDRPICIVVDRGGVVPDLDPAAFDALVTTRADAPAPWVAVSPARLDAQLARVRAYVAQAPIAASILARILRLGENVPVETALELESLAYSTLLGGGEFAAWLHARGPARPEPQGCPPVRYERCGDDVTLVLASPGNRNAMTAAMRDALFEGLANVIEDPGCPRLILRGEGACFSVGGQIAEFGSATDLARAHLIRSLRSCTALLHRLGDRAEVRVHGACIGSGIEIPAAAARRIAAPGSFVQLPEVTMGLIPGAGGTVSMARAIGRHRVLWMALGAFRVGAEQALGWGLFHAIAA